MCRRPPGTQIRALESVWIDMRGKRTLVAASSPGTLTERVEAAARGEMGPDEGEQTQTRRAHRG
jgi:hypothetical protein